MVIPQENEIWDFCPVQHPADDPNSDQITTHFEYHSMEENLLKLDMLGHDDPTMIRMMEDMTGVDAKTIPLDDKGTMSIFTSSKILGYENDKLLGPTGAAREKTRQTRIEQTVIFFISAASSHLSQELDQGCESCHYRRDPAEPSGRSLFTDRQGAGYFSGLTVHSKHIGFTLILGVEHPDRKQYISSFTMVDMYILRQGYHAGVPHTACPDGFVNGVLGPLLDSGMALPVLYIIFIREKTGKIGCFKIHHLRIVKGFDGLHDGVIQFFRAIHGDQVEGRFRGTGDKEVAGVGIMIFGIRPCADLGTPEFGIHCALAVIEPEGDIDTGDLFNPVLFRKHLRQKGFAFTHFQKSCFRVFFAGLKGQNKIGFQSAAEPSGQDGGIFAIGAECGSGIIIGNYFTAAGAAGKNLQRFLLFAVPLGIR